MMFIVILIIVIMIFVFLVKKGEKMEKKALESDRIFSNYDDAIHQEPAQRERIQRSIEHNLSMKSMLSSGYSGKVVGTTGNLYLVSLNKCTCQDFKRRRLPCKHMYYLARQSKRCEVLSDKDGYSIRKCEDKYV